MNKIYFFAYKGTFGEEGKFNGWTQERGGGETAHFLETHGHKMSKFNAELQRIT